MVNSINQNTSVAQSQSGEAESLKNKARPNSSEIQPVKECSRQIENTNEPTNESSQPREIVDLQQRQASFDAGSLQLREVKFIDEIAREKALQFMRDQRELTGDRPLILRPYESEHQARRRAHAAEMYMYELTLKKYTQKLQDEVQKHALTHQAAGPNQNQADKIKDLELRNLQLRRELDSKKSEDTSNTASSSRGNVS